MSKLNIQPVEDFNWEEFEQGTSSCAVTRSEQEAAYDATLTNVKEGEVTVGKVSAISKREVVVNIGFKSFSDKIPRASSTSLTVAKY